MYSTLPLFDIVEVVLNYLLFQALTLPSLLPIHFLLYMYTYIKIYSSFFYFIFSNTIN